LPQSAFEVQIYYCAIYRGAVDSEDRLGRGRTAEKESSGNQAERCQVYSNKTGTVLELHFEILGGLEKKEKRELI